MKDIKLREALGANNNNKGWFSIKVIENLKDYISEKHNNYDAHDNLRTKINIINQKLDLLANKAGYHFVDKENQPDTELRLGKKNEA